MEIKEFYALCEKLFSLNIPNINITDFEIEKLYSLTNRMLEVNKVMNLTAIKEEKDVILKHYVDSLLISEFIPKNSKIIDIGCGAGFPTLPLAIFRQDISITALDSTAKRIKYVSETVDLLSLNNVTAVADRAEILAHNLEYREKFDIATARAVASLPILTELSLPYVKLGGKFIAMKSQKAADELSLSTNAIKKCGGEIENSFDRTLTDDQLNSDQRNITVIVKAKLTPKDLPRHYSKINKKPL